MKERPILFSAPMVRALLSGTKTQTRRALSAQPLDVLPFEGADKERVWVGLKHRGATVAENTGVVFRCKHGEPGDRLWVRETFATTGQPHVAYRADGTILTRVDNGGEWELWHGGYMLGIADHQKTGQWKSLASFGEKWKPSIFMPRWASRLTLEVTGVRAERLQDICEADAIAEGVERTDDAAPYSWPGSETRWMTAAAAYLHGWDSINGKDSASKNPWVWVIDFRKLAPQ